MTTLSLDDDTAAAFDALRKKAEQRHLVLGDILKEMVARLDFVAANSNEQALVDGDSWLQELDRLAEETAHLPPLPPNFGREDMYD